MGLQSINCNSETLSGFSVLCENKQQNMFVNSAFICFCVAVNEDTL